MLKVLIATLLLAFAVGCAHHDASVQNSNKQEQWPGSDQSAKSQKSTNTQTGANTPAGEGDKNDHTDKLAKPVQHLPNPEATPGDVGQGNNKNPKTQGTTSGTVPKK
jgi:hypothetical protein